MCGYVPRETRPDQLSFHRILWPFRLTDANSKMVHAVQFSHAGRFLNVMKGRGLCK
jgi:hypothetical protein